MKLEARGSIAAGCAQCPREVRQDLQNRRTLPAGLNFEELPAMLRPSAERHTSGAREARRAQQF